MRSCSPRSVRPRDGELANSHGTCVSIPRCVGRAVVAARPAQLDLVVPRMLYWLLRWRVPRRYVAMLYEAWAVKTTYSGITKPAMAAAFPFPLNLYLPALMRWRNVQRCERCGINTPQRAESAARSCLAALEARLASAASVALGQGSTSEYFFGSEPSALDATVYAYIETIYRSPYNGCVSAVVARQTRFRPSALLFGAQQHSHRTSSIFI